MKKVLIATTNNDKYRIVSALFSKTIFKEDEYEIFKLTEDMNVPDEKESGDNVARARRKAQLAHETLKDQFDYYIGLDDAIKIKGVIEPNIKTLLTKILYENYLEDGEPIIFNRAYCIVSKNGEITETNIDIPYIYHPLQSDYVIQEHSYPLSQIAYPNGSDKPVGDYTVDEELEFYLKYVKEDLTKLIIK